MKCQNHQVVDRRNGCSCRRLHHGSAIAIAVLATVLATLTAFSRPVIPEWCDDDPFFLAEADFCYGPTDLTPRLARYGYGLDVWDGFLFVVNEAPFPVSVRIRQEDPAFQFTFLRLGTDRFRQVFHNRWPWPRETATLHIQTWSEQPPGASQPLFATTVSLSLNSRNPGETIIVKIQPDGKAVAEWGLPDPQRSKNRAVEIAENRRLAKQPRPSWLAEKRKESAGRTERIFSLRLKRLLPDCGTHPGGAEESPATVKQLLDLPDPSLTLSGTLPDPLHIWYFEDGTCLAVVCHKGQLLRYEWIECAAGAFRLDMLYPTLPAAKKKGLSPELGLSELIRLLGPDKGPDASKLQDGYEIWPFKGFNHSHNSWHLWYFDDGTCLFSATTDNRIDVFQFHNSKPGNFRIQHRRFHDDPEDLWDCSRTPSGSLRLH